MTIVEIARGRDPSTVFAELQRLGRAWRPAEDLPWLVYLEGASADEIAEIAGVEACWTGRCGAVARLLHGREAPVASDDVIAYATLCIDLSAIAARGRA